MYVSFMTESLPMFWSFCIWLHFHDGAACSFEHNMPSYSSFPSQHTYKQGLQHCKIGPKQSSATRNSLSAPNRSSSPNSFNLLGINENEVDWYVPVLIIFLSNIVFGYKKLCLNLNINNLVQVKFKIASCHCSLKESKAALVEVSLPSHLFALFSLQSVSHFLWGAVAIDLASHSLSPSLPSSLPFVFEGTVELKMIFKI